MSKQVRVPIQVRRRDDGSDQDVTDKQRAAAVESEPAAVEREENAPRRGEGHNASPAQRASVVRSPEPQSREEIEALKEDVETWRDRALRLQAEIENFRKRQRRLAEDRIEEDRARLLRNFLMIADNLERALQAEDGGNSALREGVGVTYLSLKQLLKQEGVERIEAEGEDFDPTWHEAVGTVPHQGVEASRDTVVDVTQAGYRLDGRLLRPARVIVAR